MSRTGAQSAESPPKGRPDAAPPSPSATPFTPISRRSTTTRRPPPQDSAADPTRLSRQVSEHRRLTHQDSAADPGRLGGRGLHRHLPGPLGLTGISGTTGTAAYGAEVPVVLEVLAVLEVLPAAACRKARPQDAPGGAGCLAPCRGNWGRRPQPPKTPQADPSPNPAFPFPPPPPSPQVSAADLPRRSGHHPESQPLIQGDSAAKSPSIGG